MEIIVRRKKVFFVVLFLFLFVRFCFSNYKVSTKLLNRSNSPPTFDNLCVQMRHQAWQIIDIQIHISLWVYLVMSENQHYNPIITFTKRKIYLMLLRPISQWQKEKSFFVIRRDIIYIITFTKYKMIINADTFNRQVLCIIQKLCIRSTRI